MSLPPTTNDTIRTALREFGGHTIDERIRNYLLSLGYSGPTTEMLSKYSYQGKYGWSALVEKFCKETSE